MKKSFFEKLKNMFKKIKFDPLRGGGILLLISLSLFSGGFASFSIVGLSHQVSGVFQVNSVVDTANYINYIDNSFNISPYNEHGFLQDNGSYSNKLKISFSLQIYSNCPNNTRFNISLINKNNGILSDFLNDFNQDSYSFNIVSQDNLNIPVKNMTISSSEQLQITFTVESVNNHLSQIDISINLEATESISDIYNYLQNNNFACDILLYVYRGN